MSTKITAQKDLTAGILYCLVTKQFDHERNEDYDSFGALVYWNGYEFVYDEGERCNSDWDYAIAQSDTPDPDYISGPQYTIDDDGKEVDLKVWRERCLAKWRAECAARGVIV